MTAPNGSAAPILARAQHPAFAAAAGLVALALAGCAGLSPSERTAACGTTDWRAYGVTDGRLGVPESERQDLFQRCLETGAAVDLAAYRAGRTEGLIEYCTAETGYEVGRDGARYRDVCTGQEELAFLQGYERGRAERPSYGYGPSIGLGIGIGSRHNWGGVGIGFPFYHGGYGYRSGFHDYCWYNRPLCRARGWY